MIWYVWFCYGCQLADFIFFLGCFNPPKLNMAPLFFSWNMFFLIGSQHSCPCFNVFSTVQQVANLETKIQKTDEEIKSLVAKGTVPDVKSRFVDMESQSYHECRLGIGKCNSKVFPYLKYLLSTVYVIWSQGRWNPPIATGFRFPVETQLHGISQWPSPGAAIQPPKREPCRRNVNGWIQG